MSSEWEELRARARQLENQLDQSLANYSRLGVSYSKQVDSGRGGEGLPNHLSLTMAEEVEGLLSKLSETNDAMAKCIQKMQNDSNSTALMYTLQRHRDILNECTQEFNKSKANILACQEHADLLSSVRDDVNQYRNNSRTDILLRERNAIMASDRMADDVLGQAAAARDSLVGQSRYLNGLESKFEQLSERFPIIGQVMGKIGVKKQKDQMVLAGVIALCMFFTFWYVAL